MKEILSQDNKKIKYCISLSKKKYRDRDKKFILEGSKQIMEAISSGLKVDFILVRDDVYDLRTIDGDSVFIKLQEKEQVIRVKSDVFNSISQTENGQGIIAVAEQPKWEPEDLYAKNRLDDNYLVLDRVQDPGNVGTLIRTAEGAGYKAVIILKGTADIFSPKIVRATGGSIMRLPVYAVDGYDMLRDIVKKLGKRLVVTDLSGDRWYYEENISGGIALVLGNEGNGVSEAVRNMADLKIKLPMAGGLESLNVAVAGGIFMYEAVRNKEI